MKELVVTSNRNGLSQIFEGVIRFLKNLTANPQLIRFTKVTALYEKRLHESNFEKSFIISLETNMKKTISGMLSEINFENYKPGSWPI